MCKCDPNIRTPFCGKVGCRWPKGDGKLQTPCIISEDDKVEFVPQIKDIAKVKLNPGELLVIELPEHATIRQHKLLREHLSLAAPDLVDRTLIHHGLKFTKITSEEFDQDAN